jgi:hypothetical protein
MMERVNLGYSTKNIPFTDQRNYKIQLIEKVEALIRRMRWKATFFLSRPQEEDEPIKIENYGLKSLKCPPVVKELSQFEYELLQLAKDVKFRNIKNSFQTRLKEDAKSIRNSNKTLVPADKTSNLYRLTKDEYNNLKRNAITSTYKKASGKIKEKIEKSGKKFAKDKGAMSN